MEIKNQNPENEGKSTGYICPMHCEQDKKYDQPGNCPVCNMKLVKEDASSSSGKQCNCC